MLQWSNQGPGLNLMLYFGPSVRSVQKQKSANFAEKMQHCKDSEKLVRQTQQLEFLLTVLRKKS